MLHGKRQPAFLDCRVSPYSSTHKEYSQWVLVVKGHKLLDLLRQLSEKGQENTNYTNGANSHDNETRNQQPIHQADRPIYFIDNRRCEHNPNRTAEDSEGK